MRPRQSFCTLFAREAAVGRSRRRYLCRAEECCMSADSPDLPDAEGPGAPDGEHDRHHHGHKHKNKVRAAWISFVGRIVAQIAGAAATIVIGLAVVSKISSGGDSANRGSREVPPVATSAPCRVESNPGNVDLAVLPFENLSGGAHDAFVDGITAALIADLSRVDSLDVISMTSSMRYKGVRKSIPAFAEELRVDYIVAGTVAVDGNRSRITARLVDARSDHELWARQYDRATAVSTSSEGAIAGAIAREISATVAPVSQRPAGASRLDPALCDEYIKARSAARLRTVAGLQSGIRHFEQAIRLDSGYAPAHAGLASTYVLLGLTPGAPFALRHALDRARAAANAALALDPAQAEASAVLGVVAHRLDWDWTAAERAYLRAQSTGGQEPLAHEWYALLLSERTRHREALSEAEMAVELDPLMPDGHLALALVHYQAGRFDRSAAAARRALELDADFVKARLVLAWSLIERRDAAGAIAVCEGRTWRAALDEMLATLAHAYIRSGRRDRADAVGRELLALEAISPGALLRWHIARGELDTAAGILEQAIQEKSAVTSAMAVDPLLAPLRREQRFAAMFAQLQLR
jgi:TolB-like protein